MMSRDVCHVDMSRCRYQDWHRSHLLFLITSATHRFSKEPKYMYKPLDIELVSKKKMSVITAVTESRLS